jgi:hypothetical protein
VAALKPDDEAADRVLVAADPLFFEPVFALALAAPPFAADRAFEAGLAAFAALLVPARAALRTLVFEVPLPDLAAFAPAARAVPPFAADDRFEAVGAVRFVLPEAERFLAAPDEARPVAPRFAAPVEARRAEVVLLTDPRFDPRAPDEPSRATNLKKRLVWPDPISS